MSYSLESMNLPKQFDYQSSVKKYEFEWRKLTQYLLSNNLKDLKKLAINGLIKTSKFRSICWSLFFGQLSNEDFTKWSDERMEQRKLYTELKTKVFHNPHKIEDKDDNPLSQSEDSIWNQHFCDQELCSVINQDVVRTFPGIEFFRKNYIQEIMTSILFCYARVNPIMCYRQGMHEILAPIIFVIHSDQQAFLHYKELSDEIDPVLDEVLNQKYLEEDSYTLFAHIMSKIESFYRITDLVPTSTGYFPSPNLLNDEDDSDEELQEIEVVDQLNEIRDKILAKQDLVLQKHLLELDIPLALFGIRWLRLLFGREFPLQDLLILWDAIFADDENFILTNYIVVAMLVTIRNKLVTSDYTTCLTYLMKYPNTVDISHIIKLSLHMKSPNIYENPNGISITQSDKSATLPRNIKIPNKTQINSNNNNNNNKGKEIVRKRSTSLNTQITMEKNIKESDDNPLYYEKVNGIQKRTARAAVKLAAQQNSIGEPDLGVVDGYKENDPEVSILTIQHAQSIMAISRIKLLQYLAIIKQNIPEKCNDSVCQALDGIEEVCSLLKSTYTIPLPKHNVLPAPVDQAFEANEAAANLLEKNKLKQKNELDNVNNKLKDDSSNYQMPENSGIADKLFGKARNIPLHVFKTEILESDIKTIPNADPTNERNNNSLIENNLTDKNE